LATAIDGCSNGRSELEDVTSVGLTSDELAAPKSRDVDRHVRSFDERKDALAAELEVDRG